MSQPSRFAASAGVIAALTLLSRVFGLVREMVFSYYLGTSGALSAFRIAFQVPNLTRRLFGEGALSSAVVPVLTTTLRERGEEEARRFIGAIITILLVVFSAGIILTEIVLAVWRFFADDLSLRLTQVLLPYAALICTVAVLSGCLHVRRRFGVPAFVPVLLNMAEIGAFILGASYWYMPDVELMYLVCGAVLFAGLVQLALTAGALRSASLLPTLNFDWRNEQVRSVIRLMAPMALGLAAVQINTLTDNIIAYIYVVEDGEPVGPAILGFAQILYQLPLGVVGISIATAIFPLLATHASEGDHDALARTLERGVRMSLFFALPSAIGLIAVAQPLVTVLFERGEFDAEGTQRVASTLVYYSLGMAAYFSQHVVVRTFYSLHDTKTPARAAVFFVVVDVLLNLLLVRSMQEQGLALSTALCATAQVIWLGARLRRKVPQLSWLRVVSASKGMVVSTIVMAAVLIMAQIFLRSLQLGALVTLFGLVSSGIVSYAGATWFLCQDELRQIRAERR